MLVAIFVILLILWLLGVMSNAARIFTSHSRVVVTSDGRPVFTSHSRMEFTTGRAGEAISG